MFHGEDRNEPKTDKILCNYFRYKGSVSAFQPNPWWKSPNCLKAKMIASISTLAAMNNTKTFSKSQRKIHFIWSKWKYDHIFKFIGLFYEKREKLVQKRQRTWHAWLNHSIIGSKKWWFEPEQIMKSKSFIGSI